MEQEHLNALKALAEEYSIRSPQKLLQLSRKIGAEWTLKECTEALKTNVASQTLAPAPKGGVSASERPGSRLQADLMDFSQNSHGGQNQGHRYALQVSDVYTRKAWTEPLKTKTADEVNIAMRNIPRRSRTRSRCYPDDR